MRKDLEKDLEKAVKEYKKNAMRLCMLRAHIIKGDEHEIDNPEPWVAYKCTIYGLDKPVIVVIGDDLANRKNIEESTKLIFRRLEKEKVYCTLYQHNIDAAMVIEMERFRTGE